VIHTKQILKLTALSEIPRGIHIHTLLFATNKHIKRKNLLKNILKKRVAKDLQISIITRKDINRYAL